MMRTLLRTRDLNRSDPGICCSAVSGVFLIVRPVMEQQAMADTILTAASIAGCKIHPGTPPVNLKALGGPVPYRHDNGRVRGNGDSSPLK